MEQTLTKGINGNRGLIWLGMVLGSLMVCPKLMSNFQGPGIEKKDGENRKGRGF